jgi:hypothetical protein
MSEENEEFTNINLLEEFVCHSMSREVFCFDGADKLLKKIESNLKGEYTEGIEDCIRKAEI